MKSLKEFLVAEREKSASDITKLVSAINLSAKEHKFKDLLFLMTEFMEIDLKPGIAPTTTEFFMESNLFFMGEDINSKDVVTYGADPEFILSDEEDNVVLYSSKYRTPNSRNGEYSMSSLAIGADYGLLEFRPCFSNKPEELVKNVQSLHNNFEETNKSRKQDLQVKEVEAVPFLHKIQRMREVMDDMTENGGKELDYGSNRSKMGGVTAASISDVSIAGAEYYGVSLTAYDTPGFCVGTDKVLTAGGHLHFGGGAIKVLSMKQLKALVRKLDEKLVPIAAKSETEAAKLRRKYYGLPGEFRLKEYGFEYRVLSCAPFWKKNSKILDEILKEAQTIIETFDF